MRENERGEKLGRAFHTGVLHSVDSNDGIVVMSNVLSRVPRTCFALHLATRRAFAAPCMRVQIKIPIANATESTPPGLLEK